MKKIKNIKIVDPGSSPDVDTDFQTTARGPAFQYVQSKYGFDNVASLITPGPFKVKNSWKAMCTLNEVPPSKANNISKFLPEAGGPGTIKSLLEPNNPDGADLRVALSESDLLEKTALDSDLLNGRGKETGVHACGIIISSQPLTNTIPMQKRQDDGAPITQWTYQECEELGLIKMDFLGLDTIDLIENTIKNIKKTKGITIDPEEIINGDLSDQKTLELFQKGETFGIFQFGEAGVRKLLRDVKPTKFEELAAVTALYRPGPMGMGLHEDYAVRKNDPKQRIPVHSQFIGTELEKILEETLGAIIYQEEIMLIAQKCAGFSSKDADGLRKAMGKKKLEVLLKYEKQFKEGMKKNGYALNKNTGRIDETPINILWDGMVGFAAYAFNKSHSISYALNSYQAAYLKVHYPVEFMAASLQQRFGAADKISSYLAEAKKMGIEVKSPNINDSTFTISPDPTGTYIVYGLSCIKQLSNEIVKNIIEERERNGKYKDFTDFLKRNKDCAKAGTIKQLALAGGFDCFNIPRKEVFEKANDFIKFIDKSSKFETSNSLFSTGFQSELTQVKVNSKNEWGNIEKIKQEALATNMYLSGNPLEYLSVNKNEDLMQQKPLGLLYELLDRNYRTTTTQYVTFTTINYKKTKSGHKFIESEMNNGSSQEKVRITGSIVKRISLYGAMEKNGGNKDLALNVLGFNEDEDRNLEPLKPLEPFTIYKVTIAITKRGISVEDVENVKISKNDRVYKELTLLKDITYPVLENNLRKIKKETNDLLRNKVITESELSDLLLDVSILKDKFDINRNHIIILDNKTYLKIPNLALSTVSDNFLNMINNKIIQE